MEMGAGAEEAERGAVAKEEGARVAAGAPVAHRKVSPEGAMATEVAEQGRVAVGLEMVGTD